MKTKKTLKFNRPYSALPKKLSTVTVPKGSPVEKTNNEYWINPNIFLDEVVKHDATHYGFRVQRKDIDFTS